MDSATKGESLQSGERVESRIEGRSDLAPQSLEDLIRSGLKSENDFTDVTKFSDRTDGNSYNNNMINKSAFSDGDSEVAVKVNIPPANIGGFEEMGRKLSVNVREAYRFRIRRKKMLADLIRNLASLHQVLHSYKLYPYCHYFITLYLYCYIIFTTLIIIIVFGLYIGIGEKFVFYCKFG